MPRKHTGQLVEREFLTLNVWDQLDRDTCEQVARTVEKCLPDPWKFKEIAWHECGGQKRFVAFYTWKKPGRFQEATFALIPGGEVELGYDPKWKLKIPKKLTTAWLEELRQDMFDSGYDDWQTPELENGPAPEIYSVTPAEWQKALASQLSPLRRVLLEPFLVETHPQKKVRKTGKGERNRIRQLGMRLPTIDEWEWAASAGVRALWYWGDSVTVDPPSRNAFGLGIAQNSFMIEPTECGTRQCGGDGGDSLSSDAGEFQVCLVLSPWYRYQHTLDGIEDWWVHMRWRRVFPLPPEMLG
jgi:hypothetical protein